MVIANKQTNEQLMYTVHIVYPNTSPFVTELFLLTSVQSWNVAKNQKNEIIPSS